MCKFDQLVICKYKNKCYFSHNYMKKLNSTSPPFYNPQEKPYDEKENIINNETINIVEEKKSDTKEFIGPLTADN